MGANRVLVDQSDPDLEARLAKVVDTFGGDFAVQTGVEWRKVLRSTPATVVHLTMYGENAAGWEVPRWEELRGKDLLVVVGATKVPPEVYELADINAAVGNQPHSEVAALAVFLTWLTGGEALRRDLGGRQRILPQVRGKRVLVEDDKVDPPDNE
jgi:tRNA (cytidine56-2'-O)-methyltransferase